MKLSKENILLGEVLNYSLKGIIAAIGKGTGVTKTIEPVYFHVKENDSIKDFIRILSATNLLEGRDIVVIPSKVVSILEKRWVYGITIENYSRCINDLAFAKRTLGFPDKKPLTKKDQVGLDKIDPKRKLGVRYPADPNQSAYNIAREIKKISNIDVDVVLSDSDSGSRKGLELINCPTILATPIGATKGLRLLYCMRVAVAAEATRNNIKDNPALLVHPYQSTLIRSSIGQLRYPGFLDGDKEDEIQEVLRSRK